MIVRATGSTSPLRRDSEDFSLLAVWRILSVRRRTILWITASALGTALLVSLLMPTKYAAQSKLEINPENAAAVEIASDPSAVSQGEYAVNLATQANVLQSDTLALQVISQLKLDQRVEQRSLLRLLPTREEPALSLDQSPARRARLLKTFHRNLSVQVIGGTRLIQVEFLDRDPAISAAVVNTLINNYLEQYFETRYNATHQATDFLARQLAGLKTDLEISQQRLADFQRQTGILGESETNNVVMAKLEEINKQLTAAEANRIVKQSVWELAKSGDSELISSIAGTPFVQGAPANTSPLGLLPTLRAQEAQLKAEIAQNSGRLGPSFPKLIQMHAQLADLQSSIRAEVAKIAARAENDYIAARNAEEMERALFQKQKQEANQLNDSAVQYAMLKHEVDADRDLYQGLLGKLKQAGVLAGLHSSNIVVVDPARPAYRPASPHYVLNLLLGLAIGLLGGVGCAFIQDGTDHTIRTPADVEKLTGLRALGVIPNINDHPSTEQDERFRALRTRLLNSHPSHPASVFLITSALPSEGKTTVSIYLSKSLAQLGRRVLLVDADLRRPSVHRDLHLQSGDHGLSNALAGTATPAIQRLPSGLDVLPAGCAGSLPELLGSKSMTDMITAWRSQYDYIVFDTPPALAFSDASLLADSVDAVAVVTRAGFTHSDALLRAMEIFESCRAPLLGAVVNRLNFRSPEYAHYFGHSYRPHPPKERES